MVSAGKTEFQRIWGSRKLEDDWRRRNKSGFSMSDFAEQSGNSENEDLADNSLPDEENPDSIQSDAADDPHKPEFYLKQIPMTPEAMETSNEVVAEVFGVVDVWDVVQHGYYPQKQTRRLPGGHRQLQLIGRAVPREPLPTRRIL